MQSANWVEAETGRKKSSYLLPHSEAICQGDVMQIFYEQCRAEKKSRAHKNAHSPAGQSDSPTAMRFSMYPALRNYSRSIFRAGGICSVCFSDETFSSMQEMGPRCSRWRVLHHTTFCRFVNGYLQILGENCSMAHLKRTQAAHRSRSGDIFIPRVYVFIYPLAVR